MIASGISFPARIPSCYTPLRIKRLYGHRPLAPEVEVFGHDRNALVRREDDKPRCHRLHGIVPGLVVSAPGAEPPSGARDERHGVVVSVQVDRAGSVDIVGRDRRLDLPLRAQFHAPRHRGPCLDAGAKIVFELRGKPHRAE